MAPMANSAEIDDILRPLLLKDLRIQCRARDLNPAGGREALVERLRQHMLDSGDMSLATEDGSNANAKTNLGTAPAPAPVSASISTAPGVPPHQQVGESSHAATNNYIRPEGQNVGNFITDRPSSRVLAPPGGGSSISLA